jgi:hypothetical protein
VLVACSWYGRAVSRAGRIGEAVFRVSTDRELRAEMARGTYILPVGLVLMSSMVDRCLVLVKSQQFEIARCDAKRFPRGVFGF